LKDSRTTNKFKSEDENSKNTKNEPARFKTNGKYSVNRVEKILPRFWHWNGYKGTVRAGNAEDFGFMTSYDLESLECTTILSYYAMESGLCTF